MTSSVWAKGDWGWYTMHTDFSLGMVSKYFYHIPNSLWPYTYIYVCIYLISLSAYIISVFVIIVF